MISLFLIAAKQSPLKSTIRWGKRARYGIKNIDCLRKFRKLEKSAIPI